MTLSSKRYPFLSATAGAVACICAYGAALAEPDNTLGMALMSAKVLGDGTLLRGSGVVSVQKTGNGSYRVAFGRSLTSCTCLAGVGGVDGFQAYFLAWHANANCPGFDAPVNTAEIHTSRDSGGAIANEDASFHLMVFCPR